MSSDARRPATMRDVAARAGVSRSLVSTVFRDVPGASPETRDRVLAAAQELGYRPDDRARKLRSHSSRLIGVTLTATQPFHVAFTEALHDDADLRGYELSLSLSSRGRPLARAVDTLLAQRCAALILVGPTAPAAEIARLAALAPAMPLIVVDRELDLAEVDSLRVDDTAGLMASVGHLVSQRHHRIWYADGGGYVSAVPRRAAYERAMAAHGLAAEIHVLPSGGTAMSGARTAMDMIAGGELPTAFIAYNDRVACGAIDVLWRNGVRVPQDMSIVGFDNIPEAGMPHMSITTVEQRVEALVTATAETVMARLGGAAPQGLRLIPPAGLIVRGSTGPARPDGHLRMIAG
jgi:DNA-binding LacI/PurR family transcriptional regulator